MNFSGKRNRLLPPPLLFSNTVSTFVLFALALLLLQFPSASPSMLILTELGTASPLFTSPFYSVKAFSAIGPDSPYKLEYSSLDHSAPLVYLSPSDPSSCPSCCEAFSPYSNLPLSPEVSSLVANHSVVLNRAEVEACSPTVNLVSGFEKLHVALELAGARAVVFVETSYEPGLTANIVGSFVSPSDRRAAKASLCPFVAIASETGGRLVEAVKNSDGHVHVAFKYDKNLFLFAYHQYFEFPFKFVSILAFALIVLRCHSLGLRRSSSTGLPLNSTKTWLVLLALPVAGAIMTSVTLNGATFGLDPGSKMWVFYATGLLFPGLNVSSSIIVARFWSSRRAHLAASEGGGNPDGGAKDPAKTQPVRTFFIVFIGLLSDACFSTFMIFSQQGSHTNLVMTTATAGMAFSYILIAFHFLRSGIIVLRSLSSSNKPLKTMASYLLMVAGFTFMIIMSFVITLLATEKYFIRSWFFCKEEEEGSGGLAGRIKCLWEHSVCSVAFISRSFCSDTFLFPS